MVPNAQIAKQWKDEALKRLGARMTCVMLLNSNDVENEVSMLPYRASKVVLITTWALAVDRRSWHRQSI